MQKKRNEELIEAEVLRTKVGMTKETCEEFCNSQQECFIFDIDISEGSTS